MNLRPKKAPTFGRKNLPATCLGSNLTTLTDKLSKAAYRRFGWVAAWESPRLNSLLGIMSAPVPALTMAMKALALSSVRRATIACLAETVVLCWIALRPHWWTIPARVLRFCRPRQRVCIASPPCTCREKPSCQRCLAQKNLLRVSSPTAKRLIC